MTDFIQWFAGGSQNPYMMGVDCMMRDWPWIIINIILHGGVVLGYGLIAARWRTDEKAVADSMSKEALRLMRNIFLFCAFCGYGFVIVRFWWPCWRLDIIFLLYLLFCTYRYLFVTNGLRAVYDRLGSIEKLEDDLNQTKAESEKRKFFMNALSHDMRSPLNSIALNADLAAVAVETEESAIILEAIRAIKENSQAATAMLNKLLEYARASANNQNTLTVCLIDVIVGEILRRYESVATMSGLKLEVDVPYGMEIETDRSKFERVLANLVDNAIKFTKNGKVEIKAFVEGDWINILVIDTGPGISKENRLFLFDEFFQAGNYERDRNKGFGMGLAIARVFSKQLGGEVTLKSSESTGSVFLFRVPQKA